MQFVVVLDLPHKLAKVTANTKHTKSIVFARAFDVLFVGLVAHITQIAEAVVQRVTIDVINLTNGPFAETIEPS